MNIPDNIVTFMSTPELRKVLCPSNPNPNIALTSESLVETILNPSSPFKTMPLESTKEGVDCTVQDAWKLEAQFAKVSKRNSRSKSRSKWDADCPRETPIEAATGDGKLEVVGPTADDMITLQYAIKIEPGLEPQDGFRIDDVKPAELNITPPSASDSEPNSTTFIPTVKIEIEKQLADVVDVKEEVREIVLEKKKAARVKGVSFAPTGCWLPSQGSS